MRIVFSHHKCLSTWLVNCSADFAVARNETFGDFWRDLGRGYDWLFAHNSGPSCFEQLGSDRQFRGLHVVRDPRDQVVSAYFSHRYSHGLDGWSELAAHRARLERLSLDDGLAAEIEFMAPFFAEQAGWNYHDPRILELRAEQALADDDGLAFWRAALDWLAAPAPEAMLRAIVARYAFRAMAGRPRGAEDPRHHCRKGVAGDWRHYLRPRHLAALESRWGELLARLGYA